MYKYRKPHSFKRKKSILRSKYFWLIIFVILVISGIFYLICFSSFFQIKEIKISGEQKISKEALKETIKNGIEKKILFFPSQSIFLGDLNQTSKDVLKTFPLIAEIKIKRDFFNALAVNVKEREPVAILIQGENAFSIDKEGIIFEPANLEEGLVKIVDKQKTNKLGEEAINKEKLTQILNIDSKMKSDLKIPVQQFEMEADDKLNLVMNEGWQAYFDLQKDVDWQLTKLRAVLEEKIPLEKRKNLEYIELRFGNFAPFKYR
jgi:cell division protein FtsQ